MKHETPSVIRFSPPVRTVVSLLRALPFAVLLPIANAGVYTLDLSVSTYASDELLIQVSDLDSRSLSGITPLTVLDANSPNGAHATVAGSIGPGVITISGSGSGSRSISTETGWVVFGEGNAGATARAVETFLLEGGGLSGATRADIAISYYLPWTSQTTSTGTVEAATGSGFSLSAMASEVLGGPFDPNGQGFLPTTGSIPIKQQSSTGTEVNTLPLGQIVTYELNVPVGIPFELHQAIGFSGSALGGSGTGTADFSATAAVYWHGISQVTVDGVPVTGYSLRNSEGVNFNNSFAPVPEPEHYAACAAAGLVGFGLWRRTARRA